MHGRRQLLSQVPLSAGWRRLQQPRRSFLAPWSRGYADRKAEEQSIFDQLFPKENPRSLRTPTATPPKPPPHPPTRETETLSEVLSTLSIHEQLFPEERGSTERDTPSRAPSKRPTKRPSGLAERQLPRPGRGQPAGDWGSNRELLRWSGDEDIAASRARLRASAAQLGGGSEDHVELPGRRVDNRTVTSSKALDSSREEPHVFPEDNSPRQSRSDGHDTGDSSPAAPGPRKQPARRRHQKRLTHQALVKHQEDFKLPVGRRDPWVVLVLSCASSSLLESDFLRLAPQGQHVEGWVSGLKKVLQAHDPNTNEPLGQYYLFFENIGAADAYREEAARLHSLWRQQALPSRPGGPRMTTTTMTMTPTATSTTATSAAASERPHAFSLVPPTADLDLGVKFYVSKTVNELAAKTTLQGVFYLRSGLPRTERTARVLLALAGGAQLALGAVRAAIEEDGRERNLAWRLAARRGDRSGVAPLRRNADGPADEGERGSRFLVTFADADDAPRFVRSWHKRRVEEVYEEGKKRSVVVDAMVIW